jgi:hypothetical protein
MAVGDTVVQVLRPPPTADNHEQGVAPVLLGLVIKTGSSPGTSNVMWSNGSQSLNHDDTVLLALATPFKTQYVGRRVRPLPSLGPISSERIGVIVLQDDNDECVIEMPSGTLYTLALAYLELLTP